MLSFIEIEPTFRGYEWKVNNLVNYLIPNADYDSVLCWNVTHVHRCFVMEDWGNDHLDCSVGCFSACLVYFTYEFFLTLPQTLFRLMSANLQFCRSLKTCFVSDQDFKTPAHRDD